MLRKTFAPLAAAVAIAGLAQSARADSLYAFSFGGNATGTFTTGAAAADPGFFLVTAIQVKTFIDTKFGPVAVSIGATSPTQFAPGAAFDPTTGAFLNHFGGGTFPNVGDIGNTGQGELPASGTINGQTAFILGPSFSSGSTELAITGGSGTNETHYVAVGNLSITPLSSVPEPSTLALAGTAAVCGLGMARRRRAGH